VRKEPEPSPAEVYSSFRLADLFLKRGQRIVFANFQDAPGSIFGISEIPALKSIQ